jgi:predicted TIM-barrel fold metal-dependent hydrolase
MSQLPRSIIDAHHHLWDLQALEYPWLMARGVKRFFGDPTAIQCNYLQRDLARDAQNFKLLGSVHVQVGVADCDVIAETRWLQKVADDPTGNGTPNAIVAYCDLADPLANDVLREHLLSPNCRGVRQIVGRAKGDPMQALSDALIDDRVWCRNLGRLAALGLSFDLQLIPAQMQRMAQVLARCPDLKVALCHCGSPWDQSPGGLTEWRRGLRALADNPNVCCKMSGFGMFDRQWSMASIRPVIETCIEFFGEDRCMFGSNFPVERLVSNYRRVWVAYEDVVQGLPESAQESLFWRTAAQFYRLEKLQP